MNRVLPPFFILSSLFLVAADPNYQRPRPVSPGRAVGPQQAADDDHATLEVPARAISPQAGKLTQTLPNERSAVAEKGAAERDGRDRVKVIVCVDATDADLRRFAAVDGLESLSVAGTGVTDAGLAALVKLRTLRHLQIGAAVGSYAAGNNAGIPQITNEGLKSIGQITNLESLRLCVPQITGAGMANLDGLKHLQTLRLTECSVGDDGMRSVAGHAALRRLDLGARLTPKGLAELVRLKSLDELRIPWWPKDEDLVPIGQMTNLRSLGGRGSLRGVTDEGLRHMRNMTRLRSLDLSEAPKVTDAGMAYVSQMAGLETLVLNQNISDAGIARLAILTNLTALGLSRTKVTNAGLAKLTSLRQLQRLGLMETRVTVAGVRQLRGLKKLETIDVSHTSISREDARKLEVDMGIRVYD